MDRERTMDFIVATMADVAVRQQAAEERADRMDQRFEKADQRFEKVEKRLDHVDRQIHGLQTIVKQGMKMLVGVQPQRGLIADVRSLTGEVRSLTTVVAELAVQQKRTDQKFERWLDSMNKGQNGHKKRSN
jgi:hypothetical protein